MPEFDRFDICEAYAVLEWDYHSGGWLQERPWNARKLQATSIQLARIKFRPAPSLCYRTLTENGKAIYWLNVVRWGLPISETVDRIRCQHYTGQLPANLENAR